MAVCAGDRQLFQPTCLGTASCCDDGATLASCLSGPSSSNCSRADPERPIGIPNQRQLAQNSVPEGVVARCASRRQPSQIRANLLGTHRGTDPLPETSNAKRRHAIPSKPGAHFGGTRRRPSKTGSERPQTLREALTVALSRKAASDQEGVVSCKESQTCGNVIAMPARSPWPERAAPRSTNIQRHPQRCQASSLFVGHNPTEIPNAPKLERRAENNQTMDLGGAHRASGHLPKALPENTDVAPF